MKRTDHDVCERISGSPEEEHFDTLGSLALQQRGVQWQGEMRVRTEVHDRAISLLHLVAKEIIRPNKQLFFIERDRRGGWIRCSPVGERLLRVVSADFDRIQTDYPLHCFSPVFMTFVRIRRYVPINPASYFDRHEPSELAEQILAVMLRFLALLQRMLRREVIKVGNENFRRGAMDNFNGFIDSIEWLSQRRMSVTVLRFDLYYRKTDSQPVRLDDKPDLPVLDEFMSYRERFHRSLDRRFADALLGYAWVLEYGRERGFHIHYLVILNPRGHEDHRGLVDMLGEKWRVLTENRSEFHSCNATRYTHRAVGHIRLDDPQAVTGLHLIVSYMTLASLFVKLDIQKKFRTFAKGRFPKAASPKVGRPQNRAPGSRIKISVAQARASYLKFL